MTWGRFSLGSVTSFLFGSIPWKAIDVPGATARWLLSQISFHTDVNCIRTIRMVVIWLNPSWLYVISSVLTRLQHAACTNGVCLYFASSSTKLHDWVMTYVLQCILSHAKTGIAYISIVHYALIGARPPETYCGYLNPIRGLSCITADCQWESILIIGYSVAT